MPAKKYRFTLAVECFYKQGCWIPWDTFSRRADLFGGFPGVDFH